MLTATKQHPAKKVGGTLAIDRALERSEEIRRKVRSYIMDSILLGTSEKLDDSASLLDAGILDSTGTMELVGYLEDEFDVTVFDSDIVADNLDSVDRICAFVERGRQSA